MSNEKPRADEVISVDHAFQALHYFLDGYWQRGGSSSEDLAILCGETSLVRTIDGELMPSDHALWFDFLAAIDTVKTSGAPVLRLTK